MPVSAGPARRRRAAHDYDVEELELPRRLRGTLQRLEITTVGQLCRMSSRELLALSGIGLGAVQDVRAALALHGLTLAD